MDEDELYKRACKAYFRGNANAPIPNSSLSEVRWLDMCETKHGEDTAEIRLENINGLLAVYRWYKLTDRLRRYGK